MNFRVLINIYLFYKSFLAGRSTLDNILITQEVIHTIRKSASRNGHHSLTSFHSSHSMQGFLNNNNIIHCILPGKKLDWDLLKILFRNGLSRSTSNFVMIFKGTVQRLIGRNCDIRSGPSTLGIRQMRVLKTLSLHLKAFDLKLGWLDRVLAFQWVGMNAALKQGD